MVYFFWTLLLILAAGTSGFMHEFGHYIFGWIFDWSPSMSFAQGGRVQYHSLPDDVEKWKDFVALLGGPLFTFSLAALSIVLMKKFPANMAIFSFAYWNCVFRLSTLIDGSGSDEYKMSAILGTPFLFQIVSVILCLGFSIYFLKNQELVPESPGLIPFLFIICAASYKISFGLLSKTLG